MNPTATIQRIVTSLIAASAAGLALTVGAPAAATAAPTAPTAAAAPAGSAVPAGPPAPTGPAAAGGRAPVYAHRGGTSRYVENTRKAFRTSGSQRWETDVRFTGTGHPVLLHDPTLGRFGCPTVRIAAVSTTRARACTARNGQTISTLGQFTADLARYDAIALVELKTTPTAAQWARLDRALGRVRARVVIESFRVDALTEATRRGYSTAFLTRTATAGYPAGTDWIGYRWTVATDQQVTAAHQAGLKVFAWTPELADWAAVPVAADAIVSNDVNHTYRLSPIETGRPRPRRP